MTTDAQLQHYQDQLKLALWDEVVASMTELRMVVRYFWHDENPHIGELDSACAQADALLAKITATNPEAQSSLPDQRERLDARLAGRTRPADPEDIGAPHWRED